MILGRGISSQMRAPFFSLSSSCWAPPPPSWFLLLLLLLFLFPLYIYSLQEQTFYHFSVLRQPINSCHVGSRALRTERRRERRKKTSASFTTAHRSSEQKEFSPCRPLLAQTSTTPHTEAHRHRGRRSCAWSLETYRSRREPRSKGLFFMIFPFPQFEFRIILIGFSVFWVYGF